MTSEWLLIRAKQARPVISLTLQGPQPWETQTATLQSREDLACEHPNFLVLVTLYFYRLLLS